MHVDFTGAGRDVLDRSIAHGPAHLAHALRAVRDHDCRFILHAQSRQRLDVPNDRPAIVILGDDLAQSLGPRGFHDRTLRRYLARCRAAAVLSGAEVEHVYASACRHAAEAREDIAIVETQVQHEEEWCAFIEDCSPGIDLTLCSPNVMLHS